MDTCKTFWYSGNLVQKSIDDFYATKIILMLKGNIIGDDPTDFFAICMKIQLQLPLYLPFHKHYQFLNIIW